MRVGRAGGGCAHLKDGVHSSPEILVHIQIFHGLLLGIESFKPNSSKFQGWIESLALCTDTSGPPTLRATQRTSASILPARATHGLLKTTACGYPIVVEIHSCHEFSQKNLKFQTWSVYFSQESRIHTLRKCWLKHIYQIDSEVSDPCGNQGTVFLGGDASLENFKPKPQASWNLTESTQRAPFPRPFPLAPFMSAWPHEAQLVWCLKNWNMCPFKEVFWNLNVLDGSGFSGWCKYCDSFFCHDHLGA